MLSGSPSYAFPLKISQLSGHCTRVRQWSDIHNGIAVASAKTLACLGSDVPPSGQAWATPIQGRAESFGTPPEYIVFEMELLSFPAESLPCQSPEISGMVPERLQRPWIISCKLARYSLLEGVSSLRLLGHYTKGGPGGKTAIPLVPAIPTACICHAYTSPQPSPTDMHGSSLPREAQWEER